MKKGALEPDMNFVQQNRLYSTFFLIILPPLPLIYLNSFRDWNFFYSCFRLLSGNFFLLLLFLKAIFLTFISNKLQFVAFCYDQ